MSDERDEGIPMSAPDGESRTKAPTFEQIQRRLRSWPVLALRPAAWAAIGVLSVTRRFSWSGHFECDLMRLKGPLIFAANHRSHVDTAAILDTMPPRVCKRTVVAAALDVFGPDHHNGLKRKLSKSALQLITAAAFHAFAFDRHGPPLRSVRTSAQLIRSGWHFLLYPEGTRSNSTEMGPFKAGVGVLAKFTGRAVIPVHVEGGEKIQPYGRFLPGRGHMRVRYGEPMHFQKGDDPAEFALRVQEQIRLLGQRQAQANTQATRAASSITISMTPASSIRRKQPA